MMSWCVSNVKIEPTATAIRATKQNAGDAKIDPWCALMDAVDLMALNPDAVGSSIYDDPLEYERAFGRKEVPEDREEADEDGIDEDILRNPRHPRWQEMRMKWEEKNLSRDDAW